MLLLIVLSRSQTFSLLFVLCLFCAGATWAQNAPAIIPAPVSYKGAEGSFKLSAGSAIRADNEAAMKAAGFFRDYLHRYYGFDLKTQAGNGNHLIMLRIAAQGFRNSEAYRLQITPVRIDITAGSPAGLFYGLQTVIQMLPPKPSGSSIYIPCAEVADSPRFAWRGMHLDVVRHFMPVSFVKKYIDYLALHKMNRFHWHLTDDQGWRIEIKKYPLLTKVGGCRNGTIIGHYPGTGNDSQRYCGYYTQAEIREVVRYAADRYITVIPEIEMPGHALAALTAYPQLGCPGTGPFAVQQTWGVFDQVYCAGNDSTFYFLENVLREVMQLFPSNIIHVGGDECPKEAWKRCALCQARMKKNGLKDEHELQSYFVQRIGKFLSAHGRTLLGWDEILEGGLAANAMVMSWQGEAGGIAAARQGHHVVMTPGSHCYFDHTQSKKDDSLTIGGYTPVEKVYAYEPVPSVLSRREATYIIGAQGNLWTEYISSPSKVEYMIFPRMTALSEVLWSPAAIRSWLSFEERLKLQQHRYELWGAQYFGRRQ